MATYKYMPKKGDYFTARHVGHPTKVNDDNGHVVITRMRTGDTSGTIYKCDAVDKFLVACSMAYNQHLTGSEAKRELRPYLKDKRDWLFEPVGPNILKACGLPVPEPIPLEETTTRASFKDWLKNLTGMEKKDD